MVMMLVIGLAAWNAVLALVVVHLRFPTVGGEPALQAPGHFHRPDAVGLPVADEHGQQQRMFSIARHAVDRDLAGYGPEGR